jgi:hypothetical protein
LQNYRIAELQKGLQKFLEAFTFCNPAILPSCNFPRKGYLAAAVSSL